MESRNATSKVEVGGALEATSGLSIRTLWQEPSTLTGLSSDSNINVVSLAGRLSLETVHSFLSKMRSEPASLLVLEMSRVSYLDSAGVGALVGLSVSRRKNERKLALVALGRQGTSVLQVSGLNGLLPVFDSIESAIRQFDGVVSL